MMSVDFIERCKSMNEQIFEWSSAEIERERKKIVQCHQRIAMQYKR